MNRQGGNLVIDVFVLLVLGFFLIGMIAGKIDEFSGSKKVMSLETRKLVWIDKMEDKVRMRLKDPDSAVFTGSKFYSGFKGAPIVCGYVNSKNSFGGFSGDQGFIASGDIITLEEDMVSSNEFWMTWQKVCIN